MPKTQKRTQRSAEASVEASACKHACGNLAQWRKGCDGGRWDNLETHEVGQLVQACNTDHAPVATSTSRTRPLEYSGTRRFRAPGPRCTKHIQPHSHRLDCTDSGSGSGAGIVRLCKGNREREGAHTHKRTHAHSRTKCKGNTVRMPHARSHKPPRVRHPTSTTQH